MRFDQYCWGGPGYGGYEGECKTKEKTAPASYGETQGFENSRKLNAEGDKETAAGDAGLSAVEHDPQKLPLYSAFYNAGLHGTNTAYDSAKAATRLRSNLAGFGYGTPTAQGADTELEASRAGDLARLPQEAETEAIAPEMEAAQMRFGQGAGMRNTGLGYFNTATGQQTARMSKRYGMTGQPTSLGNAANAALQTAMMAAAGV